MAHRRNFLFSLFLLLFAAAPACFAAHYTLQNGDFRFYVPDGWPRILQSSGDPEMQVFQDPAVTNKNALARVTVGSQSVPDIASFEALIARENERAQALPHYKLDKQRSNATQFYYTATDGSVALSYEVHYFLKNGYAVSVQCVHPVEASADWMRSFEKGCAATADSLH